MRRHDLGASPAHRDGRVGSPCVPRLPRRLRRPRHPARAGHQAFHAPVRSRLEM